MGRKDYETKYEFYNRLLEQLRWSDLDDIRFVLIELLEELRETDVEP